jgi:hypothetical protein
MAIDQHPGIPAQMVRWPPPEPMIELPDAGTRTGELVSYERTPTRTVRDTFAMEWPSVEPGLETR